MRGTLSVATALSSIAFAACRAPVPSPHPTFNRDIAPLVWDHCGGCHRPGQQGPFSLLSIQDVRQRARLIVTATSRHIMPPWLPEPGYGAFAGERRLRSEDVDRIAQWVKDGTPEGDPADRHAPPTWVDGWQLGQPDLVVELPEAYTLRPGGADVFRNFVMPIPLSASRFVRGMEVRPGSRGVVHHATLGIDATRASRRLDALDPEPGFEGGMFSEGTHSPDNHALGWTPGMTPVMEPADMAWRLEKGSDLIIQLHMIPSGKPEAVRPSVGFFFTDTPPTRRPMDFRLGSKTIDIPAGESAYTIEDTYVLPIDVDALSVYPHAHYLAKDMKAFATRPDGTVTWLIWIKDWDFRWQDQYRYAAPVFLPRGTTLTMRYTYDNSAGNVRNPHHPPQHVRYGPLSSDEMGDLWLRLLPRTSADADTLARSYVANELRKNIAAAEWMAAQHPLEARWRNELGARYLEAARVEEGIVQLREALRLAPAHAEAHHNLGHALQSQGRLADAVAQFREAARLSPDDDQVHLSLANALQDQGKLDEAIVHFRRAVALDPEGADAHNNLGAALASKGLVDEAVVHFRRALDIRPGYADAEKNLNQALQLQRGRGSRR
ncbi:MAG: tetratricopeptide repeat protein [Acidobacteriia bacterium]|nr:tetratricopeptide repeat protein [Terriglobia bacterium]